MKKVSIIILHYRNKELTLKCLGSINELKIENFKLEVIVVNNNLNENLAGLTKQFSYIDFLETGNNLGFAGGNNFGIRYALGNGADFIMILNNDTIADKNLLVQLIKAAEEHTDAGALSPKIYFAPGFEFHKERYEKKDWGKVIWYAGGDFDWANVYGINRGVDEADASQFEKVRETDFVTGACCLFRRKALKEVGFFDERYFMYLEDVDLSQRMKKAGWKVLYAPPAKLWHKVAQSSGIGSELNDYFLTRNRLLFGTNYAPLRTKIALLKESVKLLAQGRKWQKRGVKDFYLRRFGKGSFIS